MLNKLEGLYLNILRVVIIVLATALLAAALVGAVVAGPMLLSSFGASGANAERLVQADQLQDYLGQGQAGDTGAAAGEATAAQEEAALQADRRIREAAENIARYVQAKQGFRPVPAAIVDYVEQRAYALPTELFDPYSDSLLKLSQDLLGQTATAAPVNVDELIDWHYARFMEAAQVAAETSAQRMAENTMNRATAVAAAAFAGGLFVMFLLLVFVFVLVKIERNLRLLPIQIEGRAVPDSSRLP